MWAIQQAVHKTSPRPGTLHAPLVLYLALSAPLLFVVAECARGAWSDYHLVWTSVLQSEIGQLRSQANRNAGQLELGLRLHGEKPDWSSLNRESWLKSYWTSLTLPSHYLYAAVVDSTGRIVLHTDAKAIGQQLEPGWYREVIPAAGFDVVRLQESPLSNDQAAYDVWVPILLDRRRVGEYHQGLSAAWLDDQVSAGQQTVIGKWSGIIALATLVDLAALAALVALARQRHGLARSVRDGLRQSSLRFGQVASGLAHEIRNPLHALRINLHTLRRSFSGRVKLEQDDLMTTIAQSDRAIDSLDELMRDLLRFASLSAGERSEVNVSTEVRATLNLMNEDMRRKQIESRSSLPNEPVTVEIDPDRLRQIVLNLLTFAQNNAGSGGWVEIEVARNGRVANVFVADSGPSLSDPQQAGVFEPFQSPQETGSGLGLALVKHFAEEAGGTARYVRDPVGARFQITLPLMTAETKA